MYYSMVEQLECSPYACPHGAAGCRKPTGEQNDNNLPFFCHASASLNLGPALEPPGRHWSRESVPSWSNTTKWSTAGLRTGEGTLTTWRSSVGGPQWSIPRKTANVNSLNQEILKKVLWPKQYTHSILNAKFITGPILRNFSYETSAKRAWFCHSSIKNLNGCNFLNNFFQLILPGFLTQVTVPQKDFVS